MTKSSPSKTSSSKPAKKVAAKKAPPLKKKAISSPEPVYTIPREVKDWIERAQSTMNHQRGQIERLKREVEELKAYKKWAEHRILRSDHE